MIDDQRATPGRVDVGEPRVLESCAFTWIFDGETHLFRRMPRIAHTSLDLPTAWTPYWRLEIDEARSCFVVALNDAGTRLLRAWLHTSPCDRCRPEAESPGEAQQVMQWWKGRLNAVDRRPDATRIGRNRLLRPFGGRSRPESAS